MPKAIKYTIFKTKWGYFGLAGTEYGLLRTHLPLAEYEKIESNFLKDFHAVEYDKRFFKAVQEQITAYFEGGCVNFKDVPVVLDGFSFFVRAVLATCKDIRYGQKVSYGELAKEIGQAGAARAVGGALAKNPLPLIIPCHRVVCANGKIGGFSAAGGKNLKAKLLWHEHKKASAK